MADQLLSSSLAAVLTSERDVILIPVQHQVSSKTSGPEVKSSYAWALHSENKNRVETELKRASNDV